MTLLMPRGDNAYQRAAGRYGADRQLLEIAAAVMELTAQAVSRD